MIEVLTELGRRMATYTKSGGDAVIAARNIAADMLGREVLAEWLGRYPALPVAEARNVLVIMAGNIPFVGMHDLICVLAAGHRAIVKPSSKDFDNMVWVVEQLLDINPDLPVLSFSDTSPDPDAVIAMGGDAAVAAIGEQWAGVPMLLRGNRSSLAVLTGNETVEDLEGLADDVLMYSGLGCRNISLVFALQEYDFSRLQNIMAQHESAIHLNHRNNCRQTRALLRMAGVPHLDAGAVLLVENSDFPVQPSVLNYAFYDTLSEVTDWVRQHDNQIQCVATDHSSLITNHLRVVRLGQTQRPRLDDYPDGRDTMQFLATI